MIFIYFIIIVVSYWLIIFNAFFKLKTNMKVVNSSIDLANESLEGVSIIVPAHNEAKTIIDSINALLSLDYDQYEIIIVNDGSKDDMLELLIQHFKLKTLPLEFDQKLPSAKIKNIYTTFDRHRIIVIDKENGGKADALNAGINYSRFDYVCCIDADCLLAKDALKKISRIFARRKETIAVGGMVKALNGCKVKDGKLVKVDLPKSFIAKVQIVEYMRAFLTNRFTWNQNNGSLIISGAFGMFSKEAIMKVGGYHADLGEDMELIVRMQHFYRQHDLPYSISMASDAVCWTQLPSSLKDLKTQRIRWHRGLIQALSAHRSMLLNPKYGTVGMLSFPHQYFIEMLGPMIEMIGYIIFCILLWYMRIGYMAIFIFLLAYLYGVFQSLFAIIFERLTYNIYTTKKNTLILLTMCFLEPLFYRPITVWWRIQAFLLAKKNDQWGEIKRTKF